MPQTREINEGGGSGSGTSVFCRVGGETAVVDSEDVCTELGGTVVKPPPKPKGGICGGCGAALATAANQFGLTDGDVNGPWRDFVQQVSKLSADGQALFESLAKADEYITQTIHDDPSTMGDVMMALVAGADFARFILAKPGGKTDKFKLPKVSHGHFKRSLKGLRKASRNKKFHKVLDKLESELKRWKGKTVAQVRDRFFET